MKVKMKIEIIFNIYGCNNGFQLMVCSSFGQFETMQIIGEIIN